MECDFLFSENVIVEYNGPRHHAWNSKNFDLTAKDKWKALAFQKRGFTVVHMPFWEWHAQRTYSEKYSYLIQKVENAVLKSIGL